MRSAQYEATKAVSHSMIKEFDRSPRHAQLFWEGEGSKKQTRAMLIGKAADALAFEPEKFKKAYALSPTATTTSKAADEYRAQYPGIELCTPAQWEEIHGIAEALSNYHWFSAMRNHKDSVAQEELYLTCPNTGLALKGIPDLISGGIIIDLKTTGDASPDVFRRKAVYDKYYRQLAFYARLAILNGYVIEAAYILAIDNKAPYIVQHYAVTLELLQQGMNEVDERLRQIKECFEKDSWPGYDYWDKCYIEPLNHM